MVCYCSQLCLAKWALVALITIDIKKSERAVIQYVIAVLSGDPLVHCGMANMSVLPMHGMPCTRRAADGDCFD